MAWVARNPEVVTTELEDGAVLLNMETRLYYSLNQAGLEIWGLLEAATGPDDLAKLLTRAFALEEERARAAASRFVGELERERLVLASDRAGEEAPTNAGGSAGGEGVTRRPFAEPELVRHDEPLHELSASPFDPQLPLAE
jgi:Coenzyme PQQ synthesis protein D (PqqD)